MGVFVYVLASTAGCGHGPAADSSNKQPATPTPFPIVATGSDVDGSLFSDDGIEIARIKAQSAALGPGDGPGHLGDPIGAASNATATLFQSGKPTAVVTANHMHADRDQHQLIGDGNVVVRSLAQPDAPPAIRADTMSWHYDRDEIDGSGHVVLSRGDSVRIPGESFTADTALNKAVVKGKQPGNTTP